MQGTTTRYSTHRIGRILKWIFLDTIIIFLAYASAFLMRSVTAPLNLSAVSISIVMGIAITLVKFYLNGVYRRIWSRTSGHGIVIILRAVLFAFITLLLIDLLITPRPMPLSVLILANIFLAGGSVITRYRSRLISAFEWRWRAIWDREFPMREVEHLLIVGAGESGQATALRLSHRSNGIHYKIVGFIDDDPDKLGMYVEGKRVLGKTNDIPSLVEDYQVDLIIVAIHNIEGPAFRRILELCQETEARIKVIPDVVKLMSVNSEHQKLLRDVQPEDLIGRTVVSRHSDIDMCQISQRIVLVTGAAGSIGSELSRQMLDFNPKKLIILDNNESALHDLHIELKASNPKIDIIPALVDVTRCRDLRHLFDEYRPQIVFHAAAYKHVPMLQLYPNEALRVNIGGTLNLAELAKEYSVERFVLISTDKAVNPSNVMGASKHLCERIIQTFARSTDHDTLFTAVRFGNVLGSRGSVVPTFTRQIENGGPVTVTDPEMTRYFMSVSEAVNLVIHAAAMTQGEDIFVLNMGEVVRILDIAERMIRLRGLRPYIDIPIEFVGMRSGEKLHEELQAYDETLLPTEHPKIVMLDASGIDTDPVRFKQELVKLIDEGLPSHIDSLDYLMSIGQVSVQEQL